jgi:hypothetical protein
MESGMRGDFGGISLPGINQSAGGGSVPPSSVGKRRFYTERKRGNRWFLRER